MTRDLNWSVIVRLRPFERTRSPTHHNHQLQNNWPYVRDEVVFLSLCCCWSWGGIPTALGFFLSVTCLELPCFPVFLFSCLPVCLFACFPFLLLSGFLLTMLINRQLKYGALFFHLLRMTECFPLKWIFWPLALIDRVAFFRCLSFSTAHNITSASLAFCSKSSWLSFLHGMFSNTHFSAILQWQWQWQWRRVSGCTANKSRSIVWPTPHLYCEWHRGYEVWARPKVQKAPFLCSNQKKKKNTALHLYP